MNGQSDARKLSTRFVAIQIATSSISNIIGTILGHPLDTIRVRMQIEHKSVSFTKVCLDTYRGEGMRGFFKGLVSPVVGVTPYNALVFV